MAERKLRLIQAGVGGMGKTWWKGAVSSSADFEVVGLVDVAAGVMAEAGEALGVPAERRFGDLGEAIAFAKANGGVDAVLTVTPPAVHAVHAELTFAEGLHLLTEKPIADTLANAKKMVAWAAEAAGAGGAEGGVGRQLVVAQNYRFSPGACGLRGLVQDGPVGALGHGHLDFYIPGDLAKTFRGTMEFPLLVDMAIHHLDLIRAVTGRNIVAVTAQSFNPKWSWYRHDAGLKMLMELEGGVPFSYSGDWSAFGKATTWNGDWRLQCERGSIDWVGDKLFVHRSEYWGANRSEEPVELPAMELVAQAKLLSDFARAIRTGEPAETSGADNLLSFGAVMAAVRSAREKRRVEVAEVLDEERN